MSNYLSEQQIKAFRETGYLVVPKLFSAAEMDAMAAWADELQGWPEVPGKHMMYFEKSAKDESRILNRLENFLPYHEPFRHLCRGERMAGVVGELLGEPAVLFKDKINFKMPGGDGFAAHQDVQAGWSRYANFHITALVSIDPATKANGCLEMASHFHDRGLIGDEWTPLSEQDTSNMEFVSVETEPGDAVFFDSFAPHKSAPNLTDRARRVLYITYNAASEGDHLEQYYADKRQSYPPDIEREAGRDYVFRV
jgi:ectoine hydroxylase-related dioxygenase (phytanoyl-CoA dioxygenase family)